MLSRISILCISVTKKVCTGATAQWHQLLCIELVPAITGTNIRNYHALIHV